jgi:hypothetical protein
LPAFLDSTTVFSGLNSDYLLYLHKEIQYLVKQGGFSYSDVMTMPTFSRKIFIRELLPKENND